MPFDQLPALTGIPGEALPTLAVADLEAARSFAELEKAEATRRAYRADMRLFAVLVPGKGPRAAPSPP